MDWEDIKKATDPRKIIEAYSGTLGGMYGSPYGTFGDTAQFSPKAFFNYDDFYKAAGQFNFKDFFDIGDFYDGSN